MKFRGLIFFYFLLYSTGLMAQQVIISGNFKSTQKEFKVEDISEFQYLQPQDEKLIVKTDTGGKFSIRFDIKKSGYYRIGRNILFLSPGDKLRVAINHINPSLSSFEGAGEEANNYLKNTPFPKGGSYLESGKNISLYPKLQLQNILNKASQRKLELSRLKTVSLAFKRLEDARIKADVINSINAVQYYVPKKLKLDADSSRRYMDTFNQVSVALVNSYLLKLNKPEYLQLVVVRDLSGLILLNNFKFQKGDVAFLMRVKDWARADSLVHIMTGMDDKLKIASFQSKLASIKSLDYRQAALKMSSSLVQYGNGDLAADFLATDLNGNKHKLSDFKGKVIFIDLWATWCGPCLQEMPAFEKLKKQYSGDNNVVFVSLSIDEDFDAWKKNLKARKAYGIQWHVNRSALKDYRVLNIPRTVIISQDFKIANFQAPAPSSIENTALLNKLLTSSKPGFTIEGKLTNADKSGILFLSYLGKDSQPVRDSVMLTNGSFHFQGNLKQTTQANLLLSHAGYYVVKKNSDQTELFIGNNKLIISGTDSIANASVAGDVENLAYGKFRSKFNPLLKAQRALLYMLTPENRANASFMESIKKQNADLISKQKFLEKAFIINNPNLLASLAVLKSYAGGVIDVVQIGPLYAGLSANVKQSIQGGEFGKTIEALSATAVGQNALDFESTSESGKTIKLSDLKGKYVLLDFWASWCAPCRAENPNVLSQYKKYQSQGFEVLGVSLDSENSRDAWLKAIQDDGLIWKNVSELQGFKSNSARIYHINAIPQNFLIDPSGKIIASNLRGAELSECLNKVFSGK